MNINDLPNFNWASLGLSKQELLEAQRYLIRLVSASEYFGPYGLNPHNLASLYRINKHWRITRKVKDGKLRICYVPRRKLRQVQRAILSRIVMTLGQGLDVATAYQRGCSFVKNAKLHCKNQSSLVLDLKNAFESIRTKHIYRFLRRYFPSEPKALHKLISWLLTYRGHLRQGPTVSPCLFNLMMAGLDAKIMEIISAFPGMIYTRYGDDMCFSSPTEEFPVDEVRRAILPALESYALCLNQKRKIGRNGNMEFPGVFITGGRLRPTDKVIRKLAGVMAGPPNLSGQQVAGYKGFFHQFPISGRREAKKLLRRIAIS